ncbi:MAG: restriction endonuclease subunit S, partial [Oscillospiraceae bacterium]|nr:restriction endonuclease subunit S [Oscillospiraceae bacterium]
WKSIENICVKISSGGTPLRSVGEYYQGEIPWLRTQEVDWTDVYDTGMKITEEAVRNSSAKMIPENCVIVAMYGATAAKVCVNKIPLTTNQACCNLQIDEKVAHYRYVFYWLAKEYEKLKALGEGSQSNLNVKKVRNYQIPVPPLSEQKRIVEILDKFSTLIDDISSGLPAEIKMRHQQYEYYRDKLLTFTQAA